MPKRFEVGDGPVVFGSVLIDADDETGKARSIERHDRIHPG
jgi:calcineurin-like phosphoesterase